MDYSLNAGDWNKVFAVPSSVVDKYIKLASGNALKLLLFLTRHGGETFTAEILRAELGFEETGELEDAALFWVQRGIIKADSAKSVFKPSSAESPMPQPEPELPEPPQEKKTSARKLSPLSNGEIAKSIENSPELKTLFDEAEKMFARPLNQRERETISDLSGNYGFPCPVSLMMLNYCFKIGKATPAYISKVAENWASEEIMTVQLADEKIRALEKRDSIEKRICEAMGLNSKISANMRSFIKVWAVDWGFGEDMIMLAYNKTLDATGKWNASYANKILESWKNGGITTPETAQKADEEFKKANAPKKTSPAKVPVTAGASNNSSLDIDGFMSQIMNNYKK